MEEWKRTELPPYEVSNIGRVRNSATGRIIKTSLSNSRYEFVSLTVKHHKRYVHRLVAEAFCGGFDAEKTEVNHLDGDRTNNRKENLDPCSRSENLRHMHRVLGKPVHNQKLDKLKAAAIRSRYASGGISQKKLADAFDVSVMTVNRVIHNQQFAYAA